MFSAGLFYLICKNMFLSMINRHFFTILGATKNKKKEFL